ncbi:unnamed protein product [Staurois parvus]|uniref:Winged helix-turn helix domain-containing protein n=1 Tax=Staurois parvus TaxID=386267 RepID=A0ABN9BS20_9NEOB|nr:unnamed protein product [Staurois parvus]
MLKRTVRRSHKLSVESITKDLQTLWCLQISTTVHRELHRMGFHGQAAASKPYSTSPIATQSFGFSGVEHATTGL